MTSLRSAFMEGRQSTTGTDRHRADDAWRNSQAKRDEDQMAGTKSIIVTGQDLATILAALRYYQGEGMGEPAARSDEIHDIATNGDEEISMDAEGIDELCERLNLA